jgi:hypothetical protein
VNCWNIISIKSSCNLSWDEVDSLQIASLKNPPFDILKLKRIKRRVVILKFVEITFNNTRFVSNIELIVDIVKGLSFNIFLLKFEGKPL